MILYGCKIIREAGQTQSWPIGSVGSNNNIVTPNIKVPCTAKTVIDTMTCKVECIKQIVQKPSANGKTVKYMAVYVDKSAGFSEVIPISKSVVDYISTCKQFSIEPTLGIRLRNGVITSIVRYKIKFVHK